MTMSLPPAALDPVRLVMGGGFTYHGFPKLFSRRGHENIVSMVKQMKVPLPEAAGWAIGIIEFGGGLALVLNKAPRFVSTLVVGEVVVNLAAALVRGGFPTPIPGGDPLPGVERSLFYGANALALLLAGDDR